MKKEKNLKKETFQIVKQNFILQEQYLSEYATKSKDAIRLKEEIEDIRPPFFRDIDRILHSQSYTRYIDKTQVYSYKENDHISKRMTHVQLVSKIARTIGRALRLNTDLIEAIALGHDIGHTPLGHAGEKMLNKLSLLNDKTYFAHNIHSVRDYMFIENNGKGLNLTIQVLDGIMCHNGEILSEIYKPQSKTKEEFLKQYEESFKDLKKSNKNRPMTLEGCVVRLSDIIAYIGRDIEDAITMGILKDKDVEKFNKLIENIKINSNNIINYLVVDLCTNSSIEEGLKFSDEAYEIMHKLIEFNNEKIYKHQILKPMIRYCTLFMNELFVILKNEFDGENTIKNLKKLKKYYPELSTEFVGWLSNYSEIDERNYDAYNNKIVFDITKEDDYKRAIIIYLSGMTDKYIVKMYNTLISI